MKIVFDKVLHIEVFLTDEGRLRKSQRRRDYFLIGLKRYASMFKWPFLSSIALF
jgi:hypothetical protein